MDKLTSEEELFRRLPEIKEIEDSTLRVKTAKLFMEEVPEYFWEVPASTSGNYHHPISRGKHGLWIHTKMAFQLFNRMADSWVEAGKITEYEKACGQSAILLHDMFKQGVPQQGYTVGDHDEIAAEFLAEYGIEEKVVGCVLSHNGPEGWGSGRAPENPLEELHHLADMAGSGENILANIPTCREINQIIRESSDATVSQMRH
jgi:hypothetical protein